MVAGHRDITVTGPPTWASGNTLTLARTATSISTPASGATGAGGGLTLTAPNNISVTAAISTITGCHDDWRHGVFDMGLAPSPAPVAAIHRDEQGVDAPFSMAPVLDQQRQWPDCADGGPHEFAGGHQ